MFSHIDLLQEKRFSHRQRTREEKLSVTGGKRGRVTIHTVAALADVSISTASKALNGSGRMSAETRGTVVKKVAQEVGFRPNALARGLITKRSFTIGLLTNDTYGRFTLPVMAGISEELVGHGVSVFLCAIEDDSERARVHVDAMLDKSVDGIIASGKRLDRQLPVDLSGLAVPVVYAFTKGPADGVTLRSDDEQGARLAARCLIDAGCQRIVHVTGPKTFQSVRERADAYRTAIDGPPEVLHGIWAEAWGHEAVAQLWDRGGEKPDGIFCGNDQIARGVGRRPARTRRQGAGRCGRSRLRQLGDRGGPDAAAADDGGHEPQDTRPGSRPASFWPCRRVERCSRASASCRARW